MEHTVFAVHGELYLFSYATTKIDSKNFSKHEMHITGHALN